MSLVFQYSFDGKYWQLMECDYHDPPKPYQKYQDTGNKDYFKNYCERLQETHPHCKIWVIEDGEVIWPE